MCGIVGAIQSTFFSTNIDAFLRDAIVTGAVRGMDSTGMLQVDRKQDTYCHKLAVPGQAFLANPMTQQFVKDSAQCPINVVHHRAATVGHVNATNAHPFSCETPTTNPKTKRPHLLVGVHNGSLTNWATKTNAKKYVVDSNWALSRIAEIGNEAFKEIQGPYCFMWVNTENPKKLFVARNSGRPMHVVFTKNKQEAFFASEAGMLAWLCERNRINTADDIMILAADKIYEFDTSGTTITFTSVDTPKASAMITTTTSAVAVGGGGGGWLNDEGKKFIDGIKAAANYVAPAIDTKTIDETIAAIIDDVPRDDDDDDKVFNADVVPTEWFSDRNATVAEKAEAQKLGMFRELQWFQGITYDSETGEVIGDIDVWTKEHGKVRHTGTLRGCSEARANSQWIDNTLGARNATNGNWCVVIGARQDRVLGKILVVAELNQRGLAGLEAQYAASM